LLAVAEAGGISLSVCGYSGEYAGDAESASSSYAVSFEPQPESDKAIKHIAMILLIACFTRINFLLLM